MLKHVLTSHVTSCYVSRTEQRRGWAVCRWRQPRSAAATLTKYLSFSYFLSQLQQSSPKKKKTGVSGTLTTIS